MKRMNETVSMTIIGEIQEKRLLFHKFVNEKYMGYAYISTDTARKRSLFSYEALELRRRTEDKKKKKDIWKDLRKKIIEYYD